VDAKQIVSGAIDAGQQLLVCPLKVEAKVRAAFCSGDATTCIVVLHVRDGDLAKLKETSSLSLQKACG
jgi:hypothetical protein